MKRARHIEMEGRKYLLGHEDAGLRRQDSLGIDAVDLVATTGRAEVAAAVTQLEGRSARTQVQGQLLGRVLEVLHVGLGDRTDGTNTANVVVVLLQGSHGIVDIGLGGTWNGLIAAGVLEGAGLLLGGSGLVVLLWGARTSG